MIATLVFGGAADKCRPQDRAVMKAAVSCVRRLCKDPFWQRLPSVVRASVSKALHKGGEQGSTPDVDTAFARQWFQMALELLWIKVLDEGVFVADLSVTDILFSARNVHALSAEVAEGRGAASTSFSIARIVHLCEFMYVLDAGQACSSLAAQVHKEAGALREIGGNTIQ